MSQIPETYLLPPTLHVPNSKLPVLIYRDVLGPQPTAASTKKQIEANHWQQGGVFKTYWAHHFHSVTHECYAVFRGQSTLLLGRGPTDDDAKGIKGGVQVNLRAGDVIILPAGVAHCSIASEGGYEYVGLYPEGSPKYDNNFCKASPEETAEKGRMAQSVPVPTYDPIYGIDGFLNTLWNEASCFDM